MSTANARRIRGLVCVLWLSSTHRLGALRFGTLARHEPVDLARMNLCSRTAALLSQNRTEVALSRCPPRRIASYSGRRSGPTLPHLAC
jgi:hypothetical protein